MENLYQAPDSDIIIEETERAEFYIVSPKKFLILFFATMGLYSVYWFYQHWTLYKIKHQEDIWPIPRSLFQIFFVHSLFEKINIKLEEKKSDFSWSPSGLATIFVALSIIDHIAGRAAYKEIGSPMTDIINFSLLPLIGLILYKSQKAANLAMGDIQGSGNSYLTAANYVWIVLGCVFWLITALGYYMMFFDDSGFNY